MSWSKNYKKSIDCSNPKGFSQKAHCRARKLRQMGKRTQSEPVSEDLRNWFREKWVNIAKKKKSGGYEPCGTSGKKKGYAKCVPAAKAASMSKGEIKSAVRRKRAAQAAAGRPGKDQPGQGNKPIMVKTMKEENLQEKNKPTNPKLWARAKSLARSKFDVYPSAYANGWAAKWYRGKGGGWRSTNEGKGPCWDGYRQAGMKMKGGKMVPNCVPVTEELGKDNEWGTPELTRKMLAVTPGQEHADIPAAKVKSLKEFWMMCDTLAKYDNTLKVNTGMEEIEDDMEDMDEAVLVEKGLTPGGRIKKKLSAIRSRQKRKLAKSMALGRTASPQRIEKRAKLAARRVMYKRLLRGRSRSTLSAAERSSIEAVLKRAPIQASIKRAVIRMKPQYRSLETKRLARRRK